MKKTSVVFLLSSLLVGCMNASEEAGKTVPEVSPAKISPYITPSMRKVYLDHLNSGKGKQELLAKAMSSDDYCPLSRSAPFTGLSKRASIGSVWGPHWGSLAKRHHTWSITRNYTGYTPDGLSDAFVESMLQMALSTWASVANVSFEKVSSGGEVTFEWLDWVPGYSNAIGISIQKDEYGYEYPQLLNPSYGARIIFANYRQGSAPGSPVEDWDWAASNRLLLTAIHEVGHFLGMGHAHDDATYGCSGCTHPYWSDPSLMGYEAWSPSPTGASAAGLSAYDVETIQNKFGANPYGVPMLELWIPGWNKHYYTNSWEEANPLVHSGFATDITWFPGMLLNSQPSGSAAVHKHYTEESGVGIKYYYSTPNRLYSPTPMWYEGIMGYVRTSSTSGTVPLYKFFSSGNNNTLLTTFSSTPSGYTSQGVFAYIIPFDQMPEVDP